MKDKWNELLFYTMIIGFSYILGGKEFRVSEDPVADFQKMVLNKRKEYKL